MGRTHALTGAMMFGLAAPAVGTLTHLRAGELLLGSAVCAGAAVLPDIDHPGAGVSRTFGPITRGFSTLVQWLSGGHRHGTHSYAGSGVVALVAFGALALHTGEPRWLLIGVAAALILTAAGIATAVLFGGRRLPAYKTPRQARQAAAAAGGIVAGAAAAVAAFGQPVGVAVLSALMVLTLAAAARITRFRRGSALHALGRYDDLLPIPVTFVLLWSGVDLRVVPCAIVLGFLTHLAGDAVTEYGIPLGWPFTRARFSLGWFVTNSSFEHNRVFPACVLVFAATAAWNTGVAQTLL